MIFFRVRVSGMVLRFDFEVAILRRDFGGVFFV